MEAGRAISRGGVRRSLVIAQPEQPPKRARGDAVQRDIQTERRQWKPRVPKILERNAFKVVKGMTTGAVADEEAIKRLFPNTYGNPIVNLKLDDNDTTPRAYSAMSVGVVLSGGQAAGGHNCICGLFDYVHTYAPGSKVYGFLGGPKAICDNKAVLLDKTIIDEYRNMGGFDMLTAGRDKIETDEMFAAARATVKTLDLDGLVVIGGDDSNTNAAVLGENFLANGVKCRVIGLPKTIDGDLKNEHIEVSFGFDTAAKVYAECVGNIQVDTVSTSKYYHFVRLMGREASHLTLEVALQCQPNACLVSEEIRAKAQSLESIVKDIADLVAERAKAGKNHGVILLPEGLIDFIPEFKPLIAEINEVLATGVEASKVVDHLTAPQQKTFLFLPAAIQEQLLLDRDPHGNVQVAKIESERLLGLAVKKELKARKDAGSFGGTFNTQFHYFGYEGRCALPSDFDCNYCYSLGLTAGALLANGLTCMIASLQNLTGPVEDWEVAGVPLTVMFNIERRHGKDKPVIKKALTELEGAPFKYFAERRESWRLEDMYLNPGPIQFSGPTKDVVTATLQLEQKLPTPALPDLPAERRAWVPPRPMVLDQPNLTLRQNEKPRLDGTVAAGMPLTSQQRVVEAVAAARPTTASTRQEPGKIGVLFSGRQCPGAHNVVIGLWEFMKERNPGGTLVGFKEGTKGLLNGDVINVNDALCAKYAGQGGMDMFCRSRDQVKPEEYDQVIKTVEKLGLSGLVIVGGPHSSTTAAHLAEKFSERKVATRVIGVPAMIDGDMIGQYLEATVGFETATLCYSQLIGNLCTDAASATKYYYFVRIMGRSASHTALECALQTRPTMCLVSEEIAQNGMSLHEIVAHIADVIEARAVNENLNYGVILVPEGIVEAIAELRLLLRELAAKNQDSSKLTPWARAVLDALPPAIQTQMMLSQEESTGLSQVNNIETERLLAELVGAEMKLRKAASHNGYKASFSAICFYLGYQARSSSPSLFDCCLGSTLGYTAGLLINEGLTGYCASVHNTTKAVEEWTVGGVPLCAMMSTSEGRIVLPPAMVSMTGNSFSEFTALRQQWEKKDCFRNPGPLQFDVMTRPLSYIADTAAVAALRADVERMCDQIKAACGVGASADYLNAAQVSLNALQKVLTVISKHDAFTEE